LGLRRLLLVGLQPPINERDAGVDGLIALVGAVDGVLQAQAKADARYFCAIAGTPFDGTQPT